MIGSSWWSGIFSWAASAGSWSPCDGVQGGINLSGTVVGVDSAGIGLVLSTTKTLEVLAGTVC